MGVVVEDFNHGPDVNRIDMLNDVQGGCGEAGGPARHDASDDVVRVGDEMIAATATRPLLAVLQCRSGGSW